MISSNGSGSISNSVMTLAHRQHGVIHHTQLVEHDMTARSIRCARSIGRLIPLLPDVFVVAPSRDTFELRCHAVQLWLDRAGHFCGPTAAQLHGLDHTPGTRIHYELLAMPTVPTPSWVELHRGEPARADESVVVGSGLIASAPEHSLLDLLRRAPIEELGLGRPVPRHQLALPDGETIELAIAWPELRLALDVSRPEAAEQEYRLDRRCDDADWEVHHLDIGRHSDPSTLAAEIARMYRRRLFEIRTRRPHSRQARLRPENRAVDVRFAEFG